MSDLRYIERKTSFWILVSLITIVSFIAVGEMDYQDAKNDERVYCSMVKEGSWPNYKQIPCEDLE